MFFFFFVVTAVLLFGVLIITAFITFLVRHSNHNDRGLKRNKVSYCVVLGSGGHTTEMLELIKYLGEEYNNRTYIIAQTDSISEEKVIAFEATKSSGSYRIEWIPRSREVGQSYFSSIFSTLNSLSYAFQLVYKIKPDLVLLNGPGTCIPVALAAAFFDLIRLADIVIIYEESICRVKKLSLSGAILYYTGLVDDVLVQWPDLKAAYPRATYIGNLETENSERNKVISFENIKNLKNDEDKKEM